MRAHAPNRGVSEADWVGRLLPQVVTILNSLHVLESERQNVEWAARDLLFFAWVTSEGRPPQVTNGAAKVQLVKFAKLSGDLVAHILSMDKVAKNAMSRLSAGRDQPGYWTGSQDEWDQFARPSLPLVAGHLKTLELAAQRIALRGKGRPRKEWAFNVAAYSVHSYQRLTGRPPTILTREGVAGGPFVFFLDQLFTAIGIEASAESVARAVVRKRRKTPA